MKGQWPIWIFIFGVIAIVLFAFNYQGDQDVISLSEIFPEDEIKQLPAIEYEFVDESKVTSETPSQPAIQAGEAPTVAQKESVQMAKRTPVVEKPVAVAALEKPLEPAATPSSQTLGDYSDVSFTIQIASYKKREYAEEAAEKVKAKGYPAFVASANIKDKGIYYRIYVGNFDTKENAQAYLAKLRTDYKDAFIIAP